MGVGNSPKKTFETVEVSFRILSGAPRKMFALHAALHAVHEVMGPRETLSWTEGGPTPRGLMLELTFAVRQQNVEKLTSELMAVSTPSSPRYGQHLSNEEVNRIVAPRAADLATVRGFLAKHSTNVQSASPNSDFITVALPVEEAERMLSASYSAFTHPKTGAIVHRTTAYSLPADVAAVIDFVAPTVHLPGVRSLNQTALSLRANTMVEADDASTSNVPKNLRELYSIPTGTSGKAGSNKMAVTAFLQQYYSESALKSFWSTYCDGIVCGKGLPKLVGDATTGDPGVESMLDVETITGVAGGVEAEFWGFSGRSADNKANEPFAKWLTKLASTDDADVPKIFSTSYGEDESSWSLPAATRLNTEFVKAGARGITLLYAAGDEGANCKGGKFVPEGPGSSPYVTAVGGTSAAAGYPKPGGETAIGLSSGGFSGYWPLPAYQEDVVAAYLKGPTKLPPASRGYNTSGRAYPDIAAQASNFCVTPFGCGVAGTSCASPTAAGVFALLNDLRLQSGKASLGFLNPLIYSNVDAFNDITDGASEGCLFSHGWPAAKGWDAVTGVGTPNYAKLAKVVAALP